MESQDYDLKDWQEIENSAELLVKKIKEKNQKFRSISTVSRGGLVPARLIADRLDIKKIFVDMETIPGDSLFVDDIYDTGETFRRIMERVEDPDNLVFATLFARRKKQYPKQLVYAKLTKNSEYVVFPWDRFEHDVAKVSK